MVYWSLDKYARGRTDIYLLTSLLLYLGMYRYIQYIPSGASRSDHHLGSDSIRSCDVQQESRGPTHRRTPDAFRMYL